MSIETEKFTIIAVEPLYASDRTIRPDRMQRRQRVGFASVTAVCKECGETGVARANTPGLQAFIGGVFVTCPFCGNQEPIEGKRLNAMGVDKGAT